MADSLKRVGVVFTSEGVQDFKASMQEINASISENIAAYKLAQSQWDKNTKSSEKLADKQKFLVQQTEDYKIKVETLTKELSQMENAEIRDEAAIQKKRAQLEQAQTQLNKYEAALKNVNDKLESGAAKVQDYGEAFVAAGEKMEAAGETLTTHVTAPIVAAGAAAIRTAADFDAGMSKVSAISGTTGEELDLLRDKAREMGSKTKFSATEAADGMAYMAMAGWKTEDMLSGIEGVMNLAAASGEDLARTSDIVTDALTAFNLSAEDSGHFADVLAAASSNANTNVSMMGETFKYAAPIAGALGYSVEDTAEAIGLMANAGIKGSQAGTALRTIFNSLQGEIKIAGENLDEVTIQTANADGSMRDLGDILADVRGAFSQLSESEAASTAEALVGKNAMSGFLALMNAAPSDINKLNQAIAACDGTAAQMASTMQDNLKGQWTILLSQLQELAISFGEILMPLMRQIVAVLQNIVNRLNGLSPATKELITRVLGIAAAVGPLLLIGGKITGGIGKMLLNVSKLMSNVDKIQSTVTALSSSVQGALSGLFSFLAANPVILIIAAVIAAVALLYSKCEWFRDGVNSILETIRTNLDKFAGIKDVILEMWSAVLSFTTEIWQTIQDSLGGTLERIRSAFDDALGKIRPGVEVCFELIRSIIDVTMTAASGTITTALETIKTILETVLKQITTIIKTALSTIDTLTEAALGILKALFETAWNVIRGVVQTVTSLMKGDISGAMDGIKLIITSILDGIKSVFGTAFGAVKDIVSGIIDAIKGIIRSGLNGAKDAAGTILDGLAKTFGNTFNGIMDAAKNLIDKIKGVFNFDWKLPKIKLPHIKISGEFSLMPPKTPSFSIDWYKEGRILNRPTIFGAMGTKLLGGGEAGPEAVLPIEKLKAFMREVNDEQLAKIAVIVNELLMKRQDGNSRFDLDALASVITKAIVQAVTKLRPGVYVEEERIGEIIRRYVREELQYD